MEQINPPLFELQIDTQAQQYLQSAAKWSKFLSIVGFIFIGLLIILSFFIGSIFNTISSQADVASSNPLNGGFLTGVYIVIAIIYFFPCLYLYRFSARMINALAANDQATLNAAFSQLKACFKFMGVLTIVMLSIYALATIFGIAAGAMFMHS